MRREHGYQEDFDMDWDFLSRHGMCDQLGAAEYRRVLALWLAAGRPVMVAEFIEQHANLAPWNPVLQQ